MDVYHRFYAAYGPQHWWPGEGSFEVIAGAILTQSAAWTNVEMALANMRAAGCWSVAAVHRVPEAELAQLVRSSGYFNAKARKLKAFAAHVAVNYQSDLDRFLSKPTGPLREELLSIHGIGEETADDIMVYAAGKPSFVIDTYTRRIMDRMGIAPGGSRPSLRPRIPPTHGDPQTHRYAQADTYTGDFPISHQRAYDPHRYAAAPAAPYGGAITRPAGRYDGCISNPAGAAGRAAA